MRKPIGITVPYRKVEQSKGTWKNLTRKEIVNILVDPKLQLRPELMLLYMQEKLKEKNENRTSTKRTVA